MELHRASGRRGLGAALATTTMLLWGMLPLALEAMLRDLDPATLTWARFVGSSVVLCAVLALRRNLPSFRGIGRRSAGLLALATFFLAANYGGYIVGLAETTAADAQVIIQLAPILLAVAGVLVFREPFTRAQWSGLAVIACGLLLFVGGRDARVLAMDGLRGGQAILVLAALAWVVYGMAQKQLLHSWSSPHSMLCIYAGCALLFTPFVTPGSLVGLDAWGWALLAFCAANTIIGYGAFAEALEHWEASRVSAVLALVPLATLGFSAALVRIWPERVAPQELSPASWAGALLVVGGSVLAALSAPRLR